MLRLHDTSKKLRTPSAHSVSGTALAAGSPHRRQAPEPAASALPLRNWGANASIGATRRAGFSLIEMLVSIAIFVILATLALSAFRDSKHDKVASASRQVFASIGGARSRAAKAVEPRGVRLQQSKLDYRLISSIQYVGQSQMYDGTLRVQIDSAGTVQLKSAQGGDWQILRNEGLLRPGSRIFLRTANPNATVLTAANSIGGRWYTVATSGFDPDNDKIRIVGLVDGARWNASANSGSGAYQSDPVAAVDAAEPTFSNTFPVPYLLRLSPQELPDAEAINLPPGMVIDLPSSRIPASWAAFEDVNQNGTLDGTEDTNGLPSRPGYNNGILDDVKFDIPVSPNGTVSGAISGSGAIYLYLCHIDDVDRMRSMAGYPASAALTLAPTYLIPGDFENGSVAPYGPDHPSSERKLVCIIPQTGLVYIAPVNGADLHTNGVLPLNNIPDGWADDPYSFAREGREDR